MRRVAIAAKCKEVSAKGSQVALTFLLVLVQAAALAVLGLSALAPLRVRHRVLLLPALPVFGAALLAVVTNWTGRWLGSAMSLVVVVVVAVLLLVIGVRWHGSPLGVPRRSIANLGLGLLVCIGGATVAASPTLMASGPTVVSSSYNVDQLYFAGVSTYMVEDPLLPGPRMTDSWVENDAPATSPAADTVANHLRFGQSATAAALATVVQQPPFATVNSLSVLWLLLLGGAAFTLSSLFGLTRRWALAAAVVTTSSFFVVSQSMEGKNDGLLGASMFLLAIGLSAAVLRDGGYSWPLILIGAGLGATYSEYFLLLVPSIAGLALAASRRYWLHRLNVLAGRWAMAAILIPWALVWLAQSFKTTTRFTDGPTPFRGRGGWDLLRTYAGIVSPQESRTLSLMLGIAAVLVLATACSGWVFFLVRHSDRGILIGLIPVVAALEIRAVSQGSGNLQYRVMQLAMPALLALAVVGWSRWAHLRLDRKGPRHRGNRWEWRRTATGRASRHLSRQRLSGSSLALSRVVANPRTAILAAAGMTAAVFIAVNLLTVLTTTSYARARIQHVPSSFGAHVDGLVNEVGAANVTVVAPNLTDTAALSLILADQREVEYLSVAPSTYLGEAPHWEGGVDDYYVVGPGATVLGPSTSLVTVGEYRTVRLGPRSAVVAPFLQQPSWPRLTWMRGFPCARPGVQIVVVRGGTGRARFRVATHLPDGESLRLVDERGKTLRQVGRTHRADDLVLQTFRLPDRLSAVISVELSSVTPSTSGRSFPLAFGEAGAEAPPLSVADPGLVATCVSGQDDGMDGYDREITYMRSTL